jgi:hypothetical protein
MKSFFRGVNYPLAIFLALVVVMSAIAAESYTPKTTVSSSIKLGRPSSDAILTLQSTGAIYVGAFLIIKNVVKTIPAPEPANPFIVRGVDLQVAVQPNRPEDLDIILTTKDGKQWRATWAEVCP